MASQEMIPVYIEEPVYWQQVQVPQHVVEYCAEFTGLNPYVENDSYDDLRLTDCYWHTMKYYKVTPPTGW